MRSPPPCPPPPGPKVLPLGEKLRFGINTAAKKLHKAGVPLHVLQVGGCCCCCRHCVCLYQSHAWPRLRGFKIKPTRISICFAHTASQINLTKCSCMLQVADVLLPGSVRLAAGGASAGAAGGRGAIASYVPAFDKAFEHVCIHSGE